MYISIKNFTKNYYNRHTHKKNCLLKRKNSRGDKWSWWVCRTHRWDSGLTHTPNQSWQQNPNVKVFFAMLLCMIKAICVYTHHCIIRKMFHEENDDNCEEGHYQTIKKPYIDKFGVSSCWELGAYGTFKCVHHQHCSDGQRNGCFEVLLTKIYRNL